MSIPTYIVALFIIIKLWNQPRCLSTDELALKKDETLGIGTKMNGLQGDYAEWNQSKKQISDGFTHLQNTKKTPTTEEIKLEFGKKKKMVTRGTRGKDREGQGGKQMEYGYGWFGGGRKN